MTSLKREEDPVEINRNDLFGQMNGTASTTKPDTAARFEVVLGKSAASNFGRSTS